MTDPSPTPPTCPTCGSGIQERRLHVWGLAPDSPPSRRVLVLCPDPWHTAAPTPPKDAPSDREDLPWRVKHTTRNRSPFGNALPDRSYVYNRHGDLIAECRWADDADFIARIAAHAEALERRIEAALALPDNRFHYENTHAALTGPGEPTETHHIQCAAVRGGGCDELDGCPEGPGEPEND